MDQLNLLSALPQGVPMAGSSLLPLQPGGAGPPADLVQGQQFLLQMQQFLAGSKQASPLGEAGLMQGGAVAMQAGSTLSDSQDAADADELARIADLLASALSELLQQSQQSERSLFRQVNSAGVSQASASGEAAATEAVSATLTKTGESAAAAADELSVRLPKNLMQLLMQMPELASRLASKLSAMLGGGVKVELHGESLKLLPSQQLSTPWSVVAQSDASKAPSTPAVPQDTSALLLSAAKAPASQSAAWLFGSKTGSGTQPATDSPAKPQLDQVQAALPGLTQSIELEGAAEESGLRLSITPVAAQSPAASVALPVTGQVARPAAAVYDVVLSSTGEEAAELNATLRITRVEEAAGVEARLPGAAQSFPAATGQTASQIAMTQPLTDAIRQSQAGGRNEVPQISSGSVSRIPQSPPATRRVDSLTGASPVKTTELLPTALPEAVTRTVAVEDNSLESSLESVIKSSPKPSAQKTTGQVQFGLADGQPVEFTATDRPLHVQESAAGSLPSGSNQSAQDSGQSALVTNTLHPQLLQFSSAQSPALSYSESLRAMFPRLSELAQHYAQSGNGLYNAQLDMDPPSLGKVFVNISVRGETVSLQLAVVSPASKEQLAQGSAQLRQSLIDAGLNVVEMRIVTLDPDDHDSSSGQKQTGGGQPGSQQQSGQEAREDLAQAIKSAPRWEAALKTAGAA